MDCRPRSQSHGCVSTTWSWNASFVSKAKVRRAGRCPSSCSALGVHSMQGIGAIAIGSPRNIPIGGSSTGFTDPFFCGCCAASSDGSASACDASARPPSLNANVEPVGKCLPFTFATLCRHARQWPTFFLTQSWCVSLSDSRSSSRSLPSGSVTMHRSATSLIILGLVVVVDTHLPSAAHFSSAPSSPASDCCPSACRDACFMLELILSW